MKTSVGNPLSLLLSEAGEESSHFARDMLRIAKCAFILAEANGPELAGPSVDILEEVVVHRSIVTDAQNASGQRFVGALCG
jgi:hypothetical protein